MTNEEAEEMLNALRDAAPPRPVLYILITGDVGEDGAFIHSNLAPESAHQIIEKIAALGLQNCLPHKPQTH